MKGDGYEGKKAANPLSSKYVSPYTKYENFAGLNITRALKVGEGPIVIKKIVVFIVFKYMFSRKKIE